MRTDVLFGTNKIGKLEGDKFKTSMMGLAIKNDAGEYVAYDSATNAITNVTAMVIDGLDYVIALPATDVKVGDLILRGDEPLYVKEVNEDASLKVVNPFNDREETYLPQKMLFGFRIFIKVVSLFGSVMPKVEGGALAGGDFNALVMPMILAGSFKKDGKKGGLDDIMQVIMLSTLAGGANPFAALTGGATGGANANSLLPMLMFAGIFDKSEGENSLGKILPLLMMGGIKL